MFGKLSEIVKKILPALVLVHIVNDDGLFGQ